MGYKTKSMIYAKSLKANLNIIGEDKSNSLITEGVPGKNTKTQDNFFDGTGAKALPEKSPGDDKLIKTDSKETDKSTKAKETGAYSAGTKLLDKTGKKVGQDAGVLSGLASGSAGTQVGTAIGIMVNKSPRSTAKFDSKIKKAQGRGNLAKAARLEKREAGYAYRQEKRATRIDPTYKGKTDNTKENKLKAGKIRRGGEFYKKKVFNEVKPISTKLTKKQEPTTSMNQITSQNGIPLNIDEGQYKVKDTKMSRPSSTKPQNGIEKMKKIKSIKNNIIDPEMVRPSSATLALPTKKNNSRISRRQVKDIAAKAAAKAAKKERSDEFMNDNNGTVLSGISPDQQYANDLYTRKGISQGFTYNDMKNSKTFFNEELNLYKTVMSNKNPNFPYNKKKSKK